MCYDYSRAKSNLENIVVLNYFHTALHAWALFFQDRTGSVFSFFKGDFSLKKDTLFALPVITPACCYKNSGSILISGCIYFFSK